MEFEAGTQTERALTGARKAVGSLALMIANLIVVFDEGRYLPFEIARQVVVVKQNAVLQRLMPALDLSLGLGMVRSTAHMLHALLVEPLGQIVRHVTRTIVAEKPWPVRDGDVVKAGCSECLVEGGRDVGSAHGGTKPPGHDVAREVVKHGREIVPPPSGDLDGR